jgi:chromosome segregation ATPase
MTKPPPVSAEQVRKRLALIRRRNYTDTDADLSFLLGLLHELEAELQAAQEQLAEAFREVATARGERRALQERIELLERFSREAEDLRDELQAAQEIIAGLHDAVEREGQKARDIQEAAQEREKVLREALNGFRWLDNNRHNYGSQEWLRFFDAAMEDALAAQRTEEDDK